MPTPKFRLFAGPNASGKTHVFKKIRKSNLIPKEIYVNADKIEAELGKKRKFYFNSYRVRTEEGEFKSHILHSGLFLEKINDENFPNQFTIRSGVLTIRSDVKINSYHASFIATYLAEKLFESRQSFAFETVMSHSSKLDFLRIARKEGYKTYLYFIFTDDLNTNLARVQLRIADGGHAVSPEHTLARAPRTFKLLSRAFALADSAFVIDNSDEARLVLKKENSILYRAAQFPAILRKELASIVKRFSGTVRKISD
ncbi:MAG TPA: zeta toxin family protein [Puia sp.]|nr:zeta toxin family protein [Puia sp.]